MRPEPIYDLEKMELDFENPLFDIEEIRKINPQRHEMEQVTAVLDVNVEERKILGYKDVAEDEFWVRGHMPGFPLMPGVMMCECAAQLGGFLARRYKLLPGDFLGFGGMNDVRFRAPVLPGSRLVLMAQVTNIRGKRRAEFNFQGYIEKRLVFSGIMIGVPITRVDSPLSES
jgi:3-hydroxyacyl-[acyl-carrier-protein] dehydratase